MDRYKKQSWTIAISIVLFFIALAWIKVYQAEQFENRELEKSWTHVSEPEEYKVTAGPSKIYGIQVNAPALIDSVAMDNVGRLVVRCKNCPNDKKHMLCTAANYSLKELKCSKDGK